MIVGVGCDLVYMHRFLSKQEELANRILTEKEIKLYQELSNHRQLEFLAGRFAAKEALVKAMNRNCLCSDFEIVQDENGKPICRKEGYQIYLSISHEKDLALASVVIECDG